jgi:hypothetical protein
VAAVAFMLVVLPVEQVVLVAVVMAGLIQLVALVL